jgi:microcystin-dependent protein
MYEVYVGEVRRIGGPTAPPGWLFCDGQRLNARDYPELFAAIGTRFGGTAEQFALPNLNQATNGVAYIIAATGRVPVRPEVVIQLLGEAR